MDDLISRQAAIDALKEAENHAFNSFYQGLVKAHKIIAGLPSVQPGPQTEWVPCSEWLPEKPTGYAYYSWDGDCIPADEYIVMIDGASEPTTLFWTGDEWADIYDSKVYPVIAWMPLPEPYKEDKG